MGKYNESGIKKCKKDLNYTKTQKWDTTKKVTFIISGEK